MDRRTDNMWVGLGRPSRSILDDVIMNVASLVNMVSCPIRRHPWPLSEYLWTKRQKIIIMITSSAGAWWVNRLLMSRGLARCKSFINC